MKFDVEFENMDTREKWTVEVDAVDDLVGLLPLLDSFQYAGSIGNMPRFVK